MKPAESPWVMPFKNSSAMPLCGALRAASAVEPTKTAASEANAILTALLPPRKKDATAACTAATRSMPRGVTVVPTPRTTPCRKRRPMALRSEGRTG